MYQPNYGVYTTAPTTVYENTVLYNRHETGETVTVAGQDLVDGRTLTLVALAGNLSRTTGGGYSVDLSTLSSSTRTVAITDATGNITISFASRLNASWWRRTLSDELVANGGHVVDVRGSPMPGPYVNVTLELAGDTTYTLQMEKVGVGSGGRPPGASYLTEVAGNGSAVPEGRTRKVVVEVRDKFNNPVSGIEVTANVSRGSLPDPKVTTDSEGHAVFTYEAPADIDGDPATVAVNVSMAGPPSSGFEAGTPRNVSVTVAVQNTDGSGLDGGDGAYDLSWDRDGIAQQSGVTYYAGNDTLVVRQGTADSTITVTAETTDPTVSGLFVDVYSGDADVVSFGPGSQGSTDDAGEYSDELSIEGTGETTIYAASIEDSDSVTVKVLGVPGNDPPTASIDDVTDDSFCFFSCTTSFDVSWSATDDSGLQEVTVRLIDADTGDVVDSETVSASGTSDSGTVTLSQSGGYGEEYVVEVVATDTDGVTGSDSETHTADGDDSGSPPSLNDPTLAAPVESEHGAD